MTEQHTEDFEHQGDSSEVSVDSISEVSGGKIDVAGRDVITNNIQYIYQRALSASEEAAKAKSVELEYLATGVSQFARSLQELISEPTEAERGEVYKGLLEYDLSDADIFYGRDQAIEEFLDCIERDRLSVMQSASGSGKSSLLKAGVTPRLMMDGHLPVYLRPYDRNPAFIIKRAFIHDLDRVPTLADDPLRDYLHQVSSVLGGKTTLLIILDQFEEFFTFLEESEQKRFIAELAECLEDATLDVRWVIAIRTEHFGDLSRFRPRIRNPFENSYRLSPLTRDEAREVIVTPAEQQGVSFEPGLVDVLLDDLGETEISPPQMQLVCSVLHSELAPGEQVIRRDLYESEGRAAGILSRHLERVLSRNLPLSQRKAARLLIETLISSEKQRVIRTRVDLVAAMSNKGVSPQTIDVILNQLIDSRLLRIEEIEDGLAYELAHDYLVEMVEIDPETQARKAAQELLEQEVRAYRRYNTLISADRLDVIAQFKDSLYFSPEAEQLFVESELKVQKARAARTRIRNLAIILTIAVFVVMAYLVFSWQNQAGLAQNQAAISTFLLGESEMRGTAIFNQAATAQAASTQAIAQKSTAESEASLRATAQGQADFQREIALEQKKIALARQLAAQSGNLLDSRYDLALLLSLEANRLNDSAEVRGSLLSGLIQNPSLITFMSGHAGSIDSLALSPDGQTLATGGNDGAVILWDVETQRQISPPLVAHSGEVLALAYSPDGSTLASGSADRSIILWELQTQNQIGAPLTGHADKVTSIVFSPDGETLISGSLDGTIIFWDLITHRPDGAPLSGHEEGIYHIALSPSGEILASGSRDGTIMLWDTTSRQPLGEPLSGHTDRVYSLAFSPDGNTLVSGSDDSTIIFWDLETSEMIGSPLPAPSSVGALVFSQDGRILTSGSGNSIILWDVDSRQRIGEALQGQPDFIVDLVFSPDGGTLFANGYRSAILRATNTHPRLGVSLSGHTNWVRSVAFSPDGDILASGSDDRSIRLWDVSTRRQITQLSSDETRSVIDLIFSSDGENLFSSTYQIVQLWDVLNQQLLDRSFQGNNDWVSSISVSPDETVLASGGYDGTIRFWDLSSGLPINPVIESEGGSVYALSFSPDGRFLASGGEDNTITLWDAETHQQVGGQFVGHTGPVLSLEFSPDGETLVSGSTDRTIMLWDVSSHYPLAQPLIGHNSWVFGMALSSDGLTLASGSGDNTVILWDILSRQMLGQPLVGHTDRVFSLAFSPDGKTLASASGDGTVLLWDVDDESRREQACRIAGRNITKSEWAEYLPGEPYRITCPQYPEGD